MNNSFFHKRLQSSIYRYPVVFFTCLFFYISMRKCTIAAQK